MAHGTKCDGFENDFLVFLNEDIFGGSVTIESPTLIIHDTCDPMAPAGHVDWFVSKVPHSEVASLHTAGHLIWVGPDANVMHQTRVRFLKGHHARAKPLRGLRCND